MIRLKAGVRLHPTTAMAVLLTAVDGAYASRGYEVVITSGTEGAHSRGSEHYVGHALDFRTAGIPSDQAEEIRAEIANRLGPDFDVLLEVDHLHAEFDPK